MLYKDCDGFGVTTSNRPSTSSKDYDIIHDILRELKLRSESSSRTLFVKVYGHSQGDPLHEEADRLAVEGADKESDDEDTLHL